MVRRTVLGWSELAALVMSLWAAACGDKDNSNAGDGPCKGGPAPICAEGFGYFNNKTCTCERSADAGTDSATVVDAAAATSCAMPLAVQDAGANVVACLVARASLECPVAGGGSCGCLSEDPKSCSECGASTMCSNRCEAHEYAMACGGPPRRDGGSYAEAPASCRSVAGFPSGSAVYCCPCL